MNLSIIRGRQLIYLSVIFSCGLLSSCFSDVRMGDAIVWRQGEDVCFAPSVGGGELPTLHAVQVYDISVSPAVAVWSFYFPVDVSRVAGSDCLSYGILPLGAKDRGRARKLQVGHVYEVYINAQYSDPYSPVSGFSRRFCLKEGRADVVLINYNEKVGWDYSQCE